MKNQSELFFSIDIETDGPVPGINSMLSFAAVAFDEDANILGHFEANLTPLPDAVQNEKTMTEFWAKNPEAWEYATKNARLPRDAMREFVKWVDSFEGIKSAVCQPVGFDFTFMYWYMICFAGRSPFGFSAIDMKTYASAVRKEGYKRGSKRYWPRRWFINGLPHTHKAIDDALEQGASFMVMRAENLWGVEAAKEVAKKEFKLV